MLLIFVFIYHRRATECTTAEMMLSVHATVEYIDLIDIFVFDARLHTDCGRATYAFSCTLDLFYTHTHIYIYTRKKRRLKESLFASEERNKLNSSENVTLERANLFISDWLQHDDWRIGAGRLQRFLSYYKFE